MWLKLVAARAVYATCHVACRSVQPLPNAFGLLFTFYLILQGIISGTLLVTCNTVMFDPSVSDPLVLEHGPDDYHVATPVESIMQMTIYEDITAKCFSWYVRSCVANFFIC